MSHPSTTSLCHWGQEPLALVPEVPDPDGTPRPAEDESHGRVPGSVPGTSTVQPSATDGGAGAWLGAWLAEYNGHERQEHLGALSKHKAPATQRG